AILPPPTDDVLGGRDAKQSRDVGRIVLQVAVERRDEAATRIGEAGGERRRLTEVPREPDRPHTWIPLLKITHSRKRPIAAPIVDQDDFIGDVERVEDARELGVERLDVRLFV